MSEELEMIQETKWQRRRREKQEAKVRAHEQYVKNVINYNRVAAIELANRAKEKKPHPGAFVSIQKVNKIYDNLVQAVYDFDLDIKKNEFIVFVGPSGCGKSTTLRMIAGLEEITAGNLFIGQTYANSLPPKDRDIAMVFQSYALYPHMSVYDNMAFALKIRPYDIPVFDENGEPVMGIDEKKVASLAKQISELDKQIANVNEYGVTEGTVTYEKVLEPLLNHRAKLQEELDIASTTEVQLTKLRKYTKEEIDIFVNEAAGILQLEEYLGRKPKALSGGQRQRVALGRAIVKKAKLFLMDEPLSNLDAKLRVSMRSEIKRLHKRIGATSIYVTHDQTEAMTMADRIVVMDKGWIQQIGSPKEIYDHPANVFVATFIGSPAMNIVETTMENGVINFGEAGTLKLPEDYLAKYNEIIKQKIKDIEEFEANGLKAEFDKERLVKTETISLLMKNGKYKPDYESQDILNDITFNEEETSVCEELYSRALQEKLALKAQYLEMLSTGVYKIKFGIRPEDIFVKDGNITKEAKPSESITTEVKITELLGNEYFVHVDLLNKDMIFKTGTSSEFQEGDKVEVVFDLNKIHIFDVLDNKVIF